MVARLAQEHPDKHIECLDEEICPCSTMYMIHPAYLMDVLERLVDGEIPNQTWSSSPNRLVAGAEQNVGHPEVIQPTHDWVDFRQERRKSDKQAA